MYPQAPSSIQRWYAGTFETAQSWLLEPFVIVYLYFHVIHNKSSHFHMDLFQVNLQPQRQLQKKKKIMQC